MYCANIARMFSGGGKKQLQVRSGAPMGRWFSKSDLSPYYAIAVVLNFYQYCCL
jgi:hypothetical protein